MSKPNILGTLVDPEQTYLVVQINWSENLLFPLNQGIEFIKNFAQGVKIKDIFSMEPSDSRPSLRVDIVHGRDIKETSLQELLGIAA